MKKKNFIRLFSLIMSFTFLLFAGCSAGGGSGSGSGGDQIDVLSGTKVLSRPSGYSFADAVGEYSEYYYNLYARAILKNLYNAYEQGEFMNGRLLNPMEEDLTNGFVEISGDNTFGNFEENCAYYLYDSIRYTITKVDDVYDEDKTTLKSQNVYIDTDCAWSWKIKNSAMVIENGEIDDDRVYFDILSEAENIPVEFVDGKYKYTFDGNWLTTFKDAMSWGSISYPDFSSSYVGEAVVKTENGEEVTVGGIDVTNYFESPYYQTAVEGDAVATAKNYFQDALEYAVYMFVLGYDYHTYDDNGNLTDAINTADAPYFDFKIQYDDNGYVSGMTVGGWGNDVPIVDALQIVKDRYAEIGGYVGIVDKNLEQIKRFILEKVIGSDSRDGVTVEREAYYISNNTKVPLTEQPETLTFNRNYEGIVNNIVRYACEQAPIGYSLDEEGNPVVVSLSNGFAASMITDYIGNYFFANYDVLSEGTYINDDSEIFANIDAAEYQSIVIYPSEDLIGKTLGDLWLDFEYYELNDTTKTMLDELTLNIGFRYYDHKTNQVVVDMQAQKTITYGKNGTLKDANGEDISDETMFLIGEGDGPYDVSLEEGSVEFREFDNTIGGGVINPFVSGTEIDLTAFKASKYLSGLNNARNYYKLNNSLTAGQYGTLNEAMFNGECSFIEIYFDIVKDPSKTGISYDFKVCLRTVTEHEDADAEDDSDDFNEDDFDNL